jgi:hypothetical protein
MSSKNPIENWYFLVGTWKGESKDQFGGEGVLDVTHTFSLELNDRFIMNRSEAYREGKLENAEIGIMFYDVRNKKFLRKTFFTYGFVNNEVESYSSDTEIHFDVVSEPTPQAFDGMKWKSSLRKISENEISEGLYFAKEVEVFYQDYGEVVLKRV